MKTLLLSLLTAAMLQTLSAQQEMASAFGVPPHFSEPELAMSPASEVSVSVNAHTIDDMAMVSLGKGFRQKAVLQVITPTSDVLINKEIPSGQTRVKIDLTGLENGTYTVRIKVAGRTWVKQVVKE